MSLRISALLSFAVVIALASCAPQRAAPRLAPVAALPNPSLPPWIVSISPLGHAESLAQIRVIFAKPVTKVEALGGDGPQRVLRHFAIAPALRGRFTVLTPRMVGFVAEQALPVGTRVRITLAAGLRDLAGDALAHDLAWTFATKRLALHDLPTLRASDDEPTPQPVGLRPTIAIRSNAALDLASLSAHAALLAQNGRRIPLIASPEVTPSPYPGSDAAERFNPALNDWLYDLRPRKDLQRATSYTLLIAPGVEPAYGNLPTARAFTGALRTYGAFAVTGTPPPGSPGRFANGDPAVLFTNPVDAASIAGAIHVSPSPAAVSPLAVVPDDQPNAIALNPYAFDPDRSYAITISPTVKDVFGQTLGVQRRVTVRTGDFAPGAWAPTGTSVIPAGAPVALDFYATNLPANAYQAAYAAVSPLAMLVGVDALSQLPDPKDWPRYRLTGARRNVQSVVRIPLQRELKGRYGALAYGFRTSLDAAEDAPSLVGIAQLTDLGIFAQWFPARGIVLVQHLSDGAPAQGVRVSVYRLSDTAGVPPQPCAAGTTDASGEYDVTGVDVDRCSAGASANGAPSLGFVAAQGSDVATLTLWSWSGIYRFDVNGGWTSGAPLSCGTIFSDRQLYQPGERGELTGVAYYANARDIVADRNAVYRVTLLSPSNVKSSLGTVTTDAYGLFSLPISFSSQQALGYYSVSAIGPTGNEIDGSFRVAQFKPPNFKLSVTLSDEVATPGESVRASADAAYLFGAPLQGGVAHAYVTREVASLQPKGWDEFSFGRQWFWPEQQPSFDTDVLQRDLPLDAQGRATLAVPVPRDLPLAMTYRVDMETTDVSNLSVADSKTFLALPERAIIGVASEFVGTAGSPLAVRTIVTDANGRPVAGRSVHVELQKMTYTSVTQEVEGGESAQQAVKYETVATASVVSGNAPVSAMLTPPDAGPYRIRANFAGATGDATQTDSQVFVFGPGEADWGLSDRTAVPVKLDKKRYAVGETASALIASPFARADVYVAVVRNGVLDRTTLRNVGRSVRFTFKITPQMLPNAAVEAFVVRRGALRKATSDTLSRVGMTAFDVDTSDRYLRLSIVPRHATLEPGGRQSVSFALSDKTGTPVRGEIVAMVVNDAILQLSGYRLPDLVQTVFADQPISTIFADNRENVVLKTQTPPLEKGFGYGGGYLAGAASTRVRANFRPLAYYARFTTDANGRAERAFTLPDDLTTWRVMAVGVARDDRRFASADATFISSQPLITNPLLPQFARPGDRFDLGLSVANQTGASGALALVLKLSGALAFAGGSQSQRTNEQVSTGMQAFRFAVVAGTPAPSSFEASAGLGSQHDAFRVPFAVIDRGSTASVLESGVTAGRVQIPIDLRNAGTLRVTLANSVVPQFAVPSERLMTDDALPLADEYASRLVIATSLRDLRQPYRLTLSFDPESLIATNLWDLLAFQRDDGGFSECLRAQSDPFVTSYALDALLFARSYGVRVGAGAIARATAFEASALANPARFKWCADDATCKARVRFEALWSLARAGERRSDFLPEIVARADRFDTATRIRLARYLLETPGWQSTGRRLAQALEQQVYLTGRYAVTNVTSYWGWIGSLVEAQAQMLQLLLQTHAPAERIDAAVRSLLAQQCRCGWPTADQTAAALSALRAYAATERLSRGTAVVSDGSTQLASASFGTTASSRTFAFAASSLRGGALAIAAHGAAVHYTVLYTYPVERNAPGELAAFRVSRTISVPGPAGLPVASMDLAPAAPLSVEAGKVFDVGVRVIVDHPVDRLVIDDPLPAGLEAVDTSFRTTLQAIVPQSDSWEIDAQQIYRDRVVAYAQHLGPGVYELHYLVRSVTPGTFAWPGARAYLQDAPEEFGRASATSLTVTQ